MVLILLFYVMLNEFFWLSVMIVSVSLLIVLNIGM